MVNLWLSTCLCFHKNGWFTSQNSINWTTVKNSTKMSNSIQCDAISAFSSKLRFLNSWLKSGPWDVVFEKTMMYCRCFLSKALPSFSFQSSSPSIFWWFASLASLLLQKNPISQLWGSILTFKPKIVISCSFRANIVLLFMKNV